MANLHVKNMPDDLHTRLRSYAHEHNCTLSAAVLNAVEREPARWEWRTRHAQRPESHLGAEAATLIQEERANRLRQLGEPSAYP